MKIDAFYLKLDTVVDKLNPTIRATQGDVNSVPIVATITRNDKPMSLEGLVARLVCKRPSNAFTTTLVEIVDNDVVFTLSEDDISEAGECESVIALYDGEGSRVSTMSFTYHVVGDIVADSIPSGEITEELLTKLDELHLAILKIKPISEGTEGQVLTVGVDGNTYWQDRVDGVDGIDGLSAYELALEGGYIGSKEEWIISLKGERGEDGTDGSSAYELALDNGFKGSKAEWIASLKGEQGNDGYTPTKGVDYFDGKDGLSIKGDDGYTPIKNVDYFDGADGKPFTYEDFTQEQLELLKGAKGDIGDDGRSAYQIALDEGYVGTITEWLESLKAKDGIDGIDGKEYNDTEIQGKILALEQDILTKRGNDTKIILDDLETSLKTLVNREPYNDTIIKDRLNTVELELPKKRNIADKIEKTDLSLTLIEHIENSGGVTDVATITTDGLMSSTDKIEVNKIPTIESSVTNLETNKADKTYVDGKVLTDVPLGAKFTDTIVDVSNKVDKVVGKDLSTNDYTDLDKVEVGKVKDKADKSYVDNKVKTDVPLNAKFTDTIVDTSTLVTKEVGKGLSTNDYTDLDKIEVGKIASKSDKTYVDDKVLELNTKIDNIDTSGGSGTPSPNGAKIYGVMLSKYDNTPSTIASYVNDAVGLTPMTVRANTFNIGDWADKFPFNAIKPCLLKDGVVNYYLNPNDFTQKADGTPSDITSGADGDVMIEFPKIYWKFDADTGSRYISYSDTKIDNTYKCLAHMRGEEEVDKIYISAYLGSLVGGKVRSLSGKPVYANATLDTFRANAQANGVGYEQMTFYQMTMLQILYTVAFRNTDSQTALGQGLTKTTGVVNTGGTNNKGMYYGTSDTATQMKFCGIEDLYGNVRYFIDGIYTTDVGNVVASNDNFNTLGNGYKTVGQAPSNTSLDGYVVDIRGTSESGFLSSKGGGTSTTSYCDSSNTRRGRIFTSGAYYDEGAVGGIYALSGSFSTTEFNSVIGVRLSQY